MQRRNIIAFVMSLQQRPYGNTTQLTVPIAVLRKQ